MKKFPILGIIFLILSALCFTGAYARKYKAEKEEDELKRSFTLEGVYRCTQWYITDKYALKGEIANADDDKLGWYLVSGIPKDFNVVTVKDAPLISYVEYKGHKYPEIDKDGDIFSLTEDVNGFNSNSGSYARETLAPMVYAGAWRYIRRNYDKVKGCDTVSARDVIENVDFFDKEPKKTAYIMDKIDSIEIHLSNNGSKVRYIVYDGLEYAFNSGLVAFSDHNDYDLAKKICDAALKYIKCCEENSLEKTAFDCKTLIENGFLDENIPPEKDIDIELNDDGGVKRVWVDIKCYPYLKDQ
ncbi:MAG: hypothetical protein IJR59_06305 [Firmicutes bacterium]|nr:hypothetical protein [Bacillota bacterium]